MGKRNGTAQAARQRPAPKMKHRNTPRGGQRNEQADLAEEAFDDAADPDIDPSREAFFAGWDKALEALAYPEPLTNEQGYQLWLKERQK